MPSYEKNKASGLWSARFRETDEHGKAHQKRLSGFKTKKEAQYGYEDYIKNKEAAEKEKKELAAKEPKARPEDMKFSELYESWLKYKKSRTKETSHYDVKNKCDARIAPYFADMTVGEITPAKVLEWQLSLDGFSYAYKKTLTGFLSSIFIYGEKYHGIKNIMKNVDKPRNLDKKKEMQIWTPEELGNVLECTEREDMRTLFLFLYFSGCRRGEALALTWKDIDLKNGIVNVDKSITNKAHENGQPFAVVPPKNASSIRKVTIPKFVTNALKELYFAANEPSKESFVFGGDRPIPFTTIERKLKEAAEAAKVKKIRLHDFRHSCASALISGGVSIVAVSRHLGHSDIEQTLNTYSHLMPDDKTVIRNALEKVGQQIKK